MVRTLKVLKEWRGNRADAGRIRPDRFLTNNKFRALVGGKESKNGDEE